MPHQSHKARPSANMMLFILAFLAFDVLSLAVSSSPEYIDLGKRFGADAQYSCPRGYHLPVIRTKEELDSIHGVFGKNTHFWLDGELDPDCISAQNCQSSDIHWRDGGPAFNESLYDGWLIMNIDDNHPCLELWATDPPKLDDYDCYSGDPPQTICVRDKSQLPEVGLIDMRMQTGEDAHSVCPQGTDLPVIRSKGVLEKIQSYLGDREDFWLNGRMDPTCVSEKNCKVDNIVWEDGGPDFDESLYNGWLTMNIDERNWACIKMWPNKNGQYGKDIENHLDDSGCHFSSRTICVTKEFYYMTGSSNYPSKPFVKRFFNQSEIKTITKLSTETATRSFILCAAICSNQGPENCQGFMWNSVNKLDNCQLVEIYQGASPRDQGELIVHTFLK